MNIFLPYEDDVIASVKALDDKRLIQDRQSFCGLHCHSRDGQVEVEQWQKGVLL